MDENNMSPELTLDAVPTLTLDPAADEAAAAAAAEAEQASDEAAGEDA